MKYIKNILLLSLFILLALQLNTFAENGGKEYRVEDAKLYITLPEGRFFTSQTEENDSVVTEMGLNYQELKQNLESTPSSFYAFDLDNYYMITVNTKKGTKNISKLSQTEFNTYKNNYDTGMQAQTITNDDTHVNKSEVYENNNIKYIETVMNTSTFKGVNYFTDDGVQQTIINYFDYRGEDINVESARNIVNTIRYDEPAPTPTIKPTPSPTPKSLPKPTNSDKNNLSGSIVMGAIRGAVTFVIIGGIGALIAGLIAGRKRRNKNNSDNNPNNNV